LKDLAGQMNLV